MLTRGRSIDDRFGGYWGFGDVRRGERGAWLFDRIVATGSLVLRTVGGNRAGEIARTGFSNSPRVSAAEIIETLGRRTGERCCGRRIIAVQDTTEINFSGRDRARCGLGPAGDGKTPGFFMHAAVAVDAEDEAVVGLLDGAIWTRPAGPRVAARRRRGLEQKESHRWLSTAQAVAERAAGARQLIVVGDRESDFLRCLRAGRRRSNWWCERRKTAAWRTAPGCSPAPAGGRCWEVARSGWGRAVPVIRGAPRWSACAPARSASPDRAMGWIATHRHLSI